MFCLKNLKIWLGTPPMVLKMTGPAYPGNNRCKWQVWRGLKAILPIAGILLIWFPDFNRQAPVNQVENITAVCAGK